MERTTPLPAPAARLTWRNSLRTRLLLWSGLSQMALCALLLGLFYLAARAAILANAQTEAESLALQASRSLNETLGSVQVSARVLELSGAAIGRQPFNLRSLLRATVLGDDNIDGAMLVLAHDALGPGTPGFTWYLRRDGGQRLREMSEADLRYDPEQQWWYERTVTGGAAWWSEPYRNTNTAAEDFVTYNVPLRRPGDSPRARPIGMVSADLPVARLRRMLATLPHDAGVEALLLSPQSRVVVSTRDAALEGHTLEQLVGDQRADLAPLRTALRGLGQNDKPLVFRHRAREQSLYTVAVPVEDSGWHIALSVSRDYVLARLNRVAVWLALGALLGTALAWWIGRRISRNVAGPIEDLSGSAQGFKQGQFQQPLPHTERDDEVGVLARALDSARHSIRDQMMEIETLATERQRLESELSIARDIQTAMLPVGRIIEGHRAIVEVGARLQPAQLVGGDFYQFSEVQPGMLWFAVGDVSDKGLPAALFMARATSVLEISARAARPVDEVLRAAARRLAENNDTCMFTSVLCGRVDVETGEFWMASAGHEPPLRLCANGHVETVAMETGSVLGIEADLRFPVLHGTLSRGETLVLFTDGVSEAFDGDNHAFGRSGLRQALQAGLSAQAQCDHVLEQVHLHAGDAAQSDDITLLAIRLPEDHTPSVVEIPEMTVEPAVAVAAFRTRLRMPLRHDSLGTLTDAVDARLAGWGLDSEAINDARLVTEELGVNLIEYGRAPGHEAPPMELSMSLQDGSLQMQFRDQGVAFDPWAQPEPDLDEDLLERPVGGLGLHLVRNIATSVSYRREGNANVVGVILSASPTAPDGAETP